MTGITEGLCILILNEVFSQKKDKDFGNNTFFIDASKKLELDNLLDNYKRIKSEKVVKKELKRDYNEPQKSNHLKQFSYSKC